MNLRIFIRALCSDIHRESHNLSLSLALQNVVSLCKNGQLEKALSLFYSLSHNPPLFHYSHSQQAYATLFHACALHNSLQQGKNLHTHMLKHNPSYANDMFVTNHLINMYGKCGQLDFAYTLFDEMPRRNVVSWTALISGYNQHGKDDECFDLFRLMLGDTRCRPTEFAFASVLSSCGSNRGRGRQVHGMALKMSLDACVYVGNALITMYCKSSEYGEYCDDKDEAWVVFGTMVCRNLITWNCLIAGLEFRGLIKDVLYAVSEMHHMGIGFDRATLLSILSALCKGSEYCIDMNLKRCHVLHGLIIKTGFLSQIEVVTALVKAYSNLGGEMADYKALFLETSNQRDIVSWTGFMTVFAEQEAEEALVLFHRLRQEGLTPDCYTLSIILKACAGFATERHALAVHAQIIRVGFEDDTVLGNALMHAYGRCGSIALSQQVFDEIKLRDIVSWNSMIKAYAVHGKAKEALQLYSEMDIRPDSATFLAILTACSHAGAVEEGRRIFSVMHENHGVAPQLDHYACMVDMLGRAGKISEAKDIIRKMPLEPDSVVWSALLGACRKHGEIQLAQFAATKLKELDPKNSLGYIQMSNMYCTGGSFDEAHMVRMKMEGNRVRKEPGLSWIEISNQVHEFASGGQWHPQRDAIIVKLKEMVGQLKELGYVPETSLALRDIEEEHKEELLHFHSEKLALAFAVMNAYRLDFNGGVIRIMKNIRICIDCHNFMKLASGLIQKEIIIRDSNRFHHFKEKVCSCNDYW